MAEVDGAFDAPEPRPGPLEGIRVVEIASIGPAPFAAMVLSDLGADVIRIDRTSGPPPPYGRGDALYRGRRSIALDLKQQEGIDVALSLIDQADVVLEPFRPGVAERLGIGPKVCLERNPGLVYGRMTGWGQEGPLAHKAGHDINFISIAGALWPIGPADGPPAVPLNLVGDFGGGGMLLVLGVLAALHHAERTGIGQVIDAAMVDGANLLMTFVWGLRAVGDWNDARSGNSLDGSSPFYRCYTCADGKFVAVGAVESQFYNELLKVTELANDPLCADQHNAANWPAMVSRFAEVFARRTQAQWVERAADADACLTPVLDYSEVLAEPHNVQRGSYVEFDGVTQPAPAPRFSVTPAAISRGPSMPGEDSDEILADWLGAGPELARQLRASKALN